MFDNSTLLLLAHSCSSGFGHFAACSPASQNYREIRQSARNNQDGFTIIIATTRMSSYLKIYRYFKFLSPFQVITLKCFHFSSSSQTNDNKSPKVYSSSFIRSDRERPKAYREQREPTLRAVGIELCVTAAFDCVNGLWPSHSRKSCSLQL